MKLASNTLHASQPSGQVLLCADDFAMSEGITRGIEELASGHRLSATSAIVTGPHWKRHGSRLAALRGTIAVGLHLNLTHGPPLGPMPRLAPGRGLPSVGKLIGLALSSGLDRIEITEQIERQLDCFEQAVGFTPDHIDGHQHVHVLPGVRRPLVEVLKRRFPGREILVRDPGDSFGPIASRPHRGKALLIAALATGFGPSIRAAGFPTNDGFAGFSDFNTASAYDEELEFMLDMPGSRPLAMCHPGYPDAELRRIDPIVDRRRQELRSMLAFPDLPLRIAHPLRLSSGAIDWATATTGTKAVHPLALV